MTNHGYWNISGDDQESAKTHTVQMFCSKYAVVDENLVWARVVFTRPVDYACTAFVPTLSMISANIYADGCF